MGEVSNAKIMLAVGVVLLVSGAVMPSTSTETLRVCPDEPCSSSERVSVEREVKNTMKIPLVVGGVVLTIVGAGEEYGDRGDGADGGG